MSLNSSSDNLEVILKKVLSATLYGITSFLITIVNKTVLSSYKFPSLLTLCLGQLCATILILNIGKRLDLLSFPDIGYKNSRRLFPLSVIFMGNMIFGLGATKTVSLPMFAALRRVSILITMLSEYLILSIKPNMTIQLSVYSMVGGAVIAAMDDLSFNVFGYFYIMVTNILTAANGVYVKKILNTNEIGKYGLMYYNSMFIFIPTFILAWFMGDLHNAIKFEHWNDPVFLAQFLFSCFMGFILSYSTILSTHYNSALTTAIIGSIKNIAVTYLGMFIGGDFLFSWFNCIGINISVIGSLIYTYLTFLKYNTKKNIN